MRERTEEPVAGPRRRQRSCGAHRLALCTAFATFALLFLGGLVTSLGAGLSVPDWPTTFGYNMFLYPWSKMVGDIFYEHSHRLVASAVGLLTLLLAVLLWLGEERWWVRALGFLAVLLVVVQGVIGGLRVILVEEVLAVVHGLLAQAFFALIVSLVIFTSGRWRALGKGALTDQGAVRLLSVLTTLLVYSQGGMGAVVRYTGRGLGLHLVFAALVTVHVILLLAAVLRFHRREPALLWPAILLGGLLFLQLALGIGTFLGRFSSFGAGLPPHGIVILRTSHVVTGALMLVTSLVVALRSFRLFVGREPLGLISERVPA